MNSKKATINAVHTILATRKLKPNIVGPWRESYPGFAEPGYDEVRKAGAGRGGTVINDSAKCQNATFIYVRAILPGNGFAAPWPVKIAARIGVFWRDPANCPISPFGHVMKTFFHAIAGFAIASIIAWGGLFCWGAIFLEQDDSYWDRTPYAAEVFCAAWLGCAIVTAVFAARWRRRPSS